MRREAQTITLDSNQRVSVQARQRLAPSAMQGLKVLSLPIAALVAYAHTVVEENPLLEFDYNQSFLDFEELPQETESGLNEQETEEAPFGLGDFVLPAIKTKRQAFDLNRLQDDCVETETLKSHLRLQILSVCCDMKRNLIIEELIENIDDDGYFNGNIALLAGQFAIDSSEVEALLADVQTCSPRGVGARNLGECLLLQIDETNPYYPVLSTLLSQDLDDFAQHKTAQLLKKHKLSHEALIEIRELIATLNPRPGAAFYQQQKTTYVIPDIVVSKKASGFVVEVTGEIAETIALNKEYVSLLEEGCLDEETVAWLTAKQEEANVILHNISQRKQTLYRFGLYLVEAQYGFFRFGEARLKPLTMQQAADALAIHVSTVSRTVQDKYVLTPWGTYPLKFFFCGSLVCIQSEKKMLLSSLAIKNRIKEIVTAEDRQKPLSDTSIMEILNREGVEIKRRTVAKYREALGIEKQSRRRW